MKFNLKIWRQEGPSQTGRFEHYSVENVTSEMSFLEMLDQLNENLIKEDKDPVAFDSDCREGICGQCSCVIDGQAHGPDRNRATCEVRMRSFDDGAEITVEPFRADAFPIIKDLVVDRSAFDRIISAGGYISVNAGSAPDANAILVPQDDAEEAMDAAACIGCGACVAACPNASASLFVGAKVGQLSLLPQGDPERGVRAARMVDQMDVEGFGGCSNHGECQAACPKDISIINIARLRREVVKAKPTRV